MSKQPFLLNVNALRRAPDARRRETRRGRIPGLVVTSGAVPADAEVAVDVMLEMVDGGIVATGSVVAPYVGECRRCLGPVYGTIEAEVCEVYQPNVTPEEAEEIYPLIGDQLDLEPLARDAVLLELPLAPLCREGCLGLCPTCGANLNEGSCACPGFAPDLRWEGLDVLRTDT